MVRLVFMDGCDDMTSRYIKDKDEELGSRLNLQPKQVRSALAELLAEGFAAKVGSKKWYHYGEVCTRIVAVSTSPA